MNVTRLMLKQGVAGMTLSDGSTLRVFEGDPDHSHKITRKVKMRDSNNPAVEIHGQTVGVFLRKFDNVADAFAIFGKYLDPMTPTAWITSLNDGVQVQHDPE